MSTVHNIQDRSFKQTRDANLQRQYNYLAQQKADLAQQRADLARQRAELAHQRQTLHSRAVRHEQRYGARQRQNALANGILTVATWTFGIAFTYLILLAS